MDTSLLIRWAPYAAALALIAGFVRLGWWQLDRAEEKMVLMAGFERGQGNPPHLATQAGLDDLPRYSSVQVAGEFDRRSILLDNQTLGGQPGVHVYTPLVEEQTDRAVLINRGWLPLDPARRALPEFKTPSNDLVLSGLTSPPPQPGFRLGDVQLNQQWPQLITYLDLPELSQALGLTLAPIIVLLDPTADHGFSRQWRPQVMPPSRHQGYAFQWFALALAVTVVAGLLAWRARR